MQQGKQLLQQINKIRSNPQGCIQDIKQQLSRFESNTILRTKKGQKLRVSDGKAAWQEAIVYLQRCKPKQPLIWNQALSETAGKFIKIRQTSQQVNPFKLLKSQYSYEGNISFNINESEIEQNFRELVILMIIGDADEKKGNRTTLFNPNYSYFGCCISRNSGKNQFMFIPMFFADTGKFEPKKEESFKNFYGNKLKYLERGREFVIELNKIRKQPKSIINALKSDIEKFKDQKTLVKQNIAIKTKEGRSGYLDLLSELEQQYPIPMLKLSEGLSIASVEQVVDLQDKQSGQEQAKSLTNYQTFVKKYSVSSEGVNNIIMNRSENDSYQNMLILLLVGDGDKKRSARRRLLNPVLKVIGIAIGQTYFVINIGEQIKENKHQIQYYMNSLKSQNSSLINDTKKQDSQSNLLSSKTFEKMEDRKIKKKTVKTNTFTIGDLHYRRTHTKIIFTDGQIQEEVEQELID